MADEYEPNPFGGYEIVKRGQTPGMTKMAKCYTCGAQFHGPTSALREVPTDDGWSTYLPCPTQRCSGRGVFYWAVISLQRDNTTRVMISTIPGWEVSELEEDIESLPVVACKIDHTLYSNLYRLGGWFYNYEYIVGRVQDMYLHYSLVWYNGRAQLKRPSTMQQMPALLGEQ